MTSWPPNNYEYEYIITIAHNHYVSHLLLLCSYSARRFLPPMHRRAHGIEDEVEEVDSTQTL